MNWRLSIVDCGLWIASGRNRLPIAVRRNTPDLHAPINPQSAIPNPKFVFLLCVLCVSAVILPGCQTEKITTSDGGLSRSRQTPVAPPPTPPGAKANKMAFFVGQKPDDSNGNGYPDLINVTVMLFAEPHPTAIVEPGEFVFTLYPQGAAGDSGAKPIGVWRLKGQRVLAARAVTLGGPCYQFQLSMLDPSCGLASDKLPLDQADMVCQFIPTDGSPPVKSEGVRTIQIGRRVAAVAGR